jgi:16S rRNA (adenine1518-N6/adenine1519-N6)-dimethyltransferase
MISGNLPYYITSPIIDKVLALGDLLLGAVFLVQKEVAERITAKPGSRDFGYLSISVQAFSEARILMDVPPDAFRPPPKVHSAVIELTPRVHPAIEDAPSFLNFASAAFRQKRKNLRNNIGSVYGMKAIDAQPEARLRAEQLSLEELANLHQRILKFQ